MDATTQSLLLYTVLQLCALVGVVSRTLPGKEQQTKDYQSQGNLLALLFFSLLGYLLFLFW
jgi:hypothetical protein